MKVKLKTGWSKVRFGDVVELSKERSSDPENDGFERFLGLEHIEPEDLKIRRWGNIAEGTTFTNVYRSGQVLFGKRRAYLRKVAVADFDGVCSGDIYVLKVKNDYLLPELLPYICQSENFFEHAIATSAGSLSPRTNWKSLAEYEFALPPIEEQIEITAVLNSIEQSIDCNLELRIAGYELWQSLAFKEFNIESSKKDSILGAHYLRITEQVDANNEYFNELPLITPENLSKNTGLIYDNYNKASLAKSNKFKFPVGAILYSRIRPYFNKVALASFEGLCSTEIYPLIPKGSLLPEYFLELLLSKPFTRFAVSGMKGTGFPRVSHNHIQRFPVNIPPVESQKKYLSVAMPLRNLLKTTNYRIEYLKKLKNDYLIGSVTCDF